MIEIKITADEWNVIEKRAEELPDDFHIGLLGSIISKDELLENIHEKTDIGIAYAKIQLRFIKWAAQEAAKEALAE